MKRIQAEKHCNHCGNIVYRYAGLAYTTKEAAEAQQKLRVKKGEKNNG